MLIDEFLPSFPTLHSTATASRAAVRTNGFSVNFKKKKKHALKKKPKQRKGPDVLSMSDILGESRAYLGMASAEQN